MMPEHDVLLGGGVRAPLSELLTEGSFPTSNPGFGAGGGFCGPLISGHLSTATDDVAIVDGADRLVDEAVLYILARKLALLRKSVVEKVNK